jgi:GrpB-like predicted nucleotidyltransferase (UPF0157 family)
MNERICEFVPQESIKELVDKKFQEIKSKILEMIPNADIEHVGSAAVKGALTKKDLDITVRVGINTFEEDIKKMQNNFTAVHQEVWVQNETEGMAIFKDNTHSGELESVDIMLVVKDSRFDEYHIFCEILKKDPCALQSYNDLKKDYQGKPYRGYRKAKSDFWGKNG